MVTAVLNGFTATALAVPPTGQNSSPATGTTQTQVANGSSDVLATNGFRSYECMSGGGGLTPSQQAACRSSGAGWQPEPLGNYLFDIHINTGITAFGADIASAFENLVLTPIWLAILYALHGILIAVSWALELNIFSGAMPAVSHALQVGQSIFTNPWMVSVLAIAGVGLLWHGLGRRGVAQSLGEALALTVMIICALVLIVDPQGTIGEASSLVNQASLGTAAAAAASDPTAGAQSFDKALGRVFDQAIADPFTVLEFGNLKWAHGLDPKVNSVRTQLLPSPPKDLTGHSTAQLRAANDNAHIFLAFDSNGVTRNSINGGPLLKAICGSYGDDADSCKGTATTPPSIPQFRSSNSVWQRTAALLVIVVGGLGEILVFAFVAYKLVVAALMALVLLLMTPAMALAPAFGDSGRQAFKRWGIRLIGAVLAKLVYAFFLGLLLLCARVLGQFSTGAFFIQFALLAAFWWAVFLHRHQVTEFTALSHQQLGTRALGGLAAMKAAQMATGAAGTAAGTTRPVRALARGRREAAHAAIDRRRQERLHAAHDVAREQRDALVAQSLEHDLRGHEEAAARQPQTAVEAQELRMQQDRLRERLAATDDPREQARLEARLGSVGTALAVNAERGRVQAASGDLLSRANESRAQTGTPFSAAQRREREQLIRTNAALPAGMGKPDDVRAGRARDYRTLASIAGRTETEYVQADRPKQATIRREIDRRLELFGRHDQLARHDGADADPLGAGRYARELEAAGGPPVVSLPRRAGQDAVPGDLAAAAARMRERTNERVKARSARERQFGRGRRR